jgi:3-methyladenine DNA glycosylase AlkD
MNQKEAITELKKHANPKNVEGMSRFGISSKNTLGVPVPILRALAKKIGKNHQLAQQLWDSEIHEARILASMIDNPKEVTERQMDKWIKDFDSWDICDQTCMNLFDKTPNAHEKATEWAGRKPEYEKRAGFALMACLAVHDKKAEDKKFEKFFTAIKKQSTDDRNFVKKAVNWALRQIGKRNESLKKKAIQTAREIQKIESKAAKWIAADALRELKKR